MKKLLLAGVVAAAGYVGYKRLQGDKAEQDLWAEATDPVGPPAVDPDAPATASTPGPVDEAAGSTSAP